MAAQYGAHETMEIHEVLTDAIDGINQFQLYRPHVSDPQLMQMLDHQLQFLVNEYNQLVQAVGNQGQGQAIPYRSLKNITPTYGLRQPGTHAPNTSPDQMDDRDVSSGMLGCHKASASLKMIASLECADPQIRRIIQQGAVNCAEQAYEVWQYMNQKGYYQVPTMKEMTTNTMINTFGQANMGQQANLGQANVGQGSYNQTYTQDHLSQ